MDNEKRIKELADSIRGVADNAEENFGYISQWALEIITQCRDIANRHCGVKATKKVYTIVTRKNPPRFLSVHGKPSNALDDMQVFQCIEDAQDELAETENRWEYTIVEGTATIDIGGIR